MKIVTWDDEKTKQEIQKRLKNSSDARRYFEDRWISNERSIFSTSSTATMSYLQSSLESNFNIGIPSADNSNSNVQCSVTFKNFRFIHAQMSANPPTVAMRPQTSDQDDHRKADAADRIVRWALRHYKMQEKVDQLSLHCLLYGTGFIKTIWDSTKGDIINFDTQSDEIELEGDISVSVPFIWNIRVDPDGKTWDDVKYIFEDIYMDYDEACARWPEKEDLLKKSRLDGNTASTPTMKQSQLQNKHYNSVHLVEYWEKGLPTNGFLGRYCITTPEGDVIEPVRPSPFRFKRAGAVSKIENMDLPDDMKEAKIEKLPEQADLPYTILTDVDIPNIVWGRSFLEYASQLQENLNRLDSATLDNIQAHGTARMILPESAEINEDALSNSPWDVVKITGNQPPYFMAPPQLMPDMSSARVNYINGINDVCGVNEAMFGQQSREQSGASMQYATNQGNMIRRRLFNKYVLAVESVYKSILNLVRKHWTVEHTIHVLGKEKALEAIDIKGADIDGGFDVVGEYGVTLSLDPITRREEIMSLIPSFKEAGIPIRKALEMMKLNELEGMYDALDLAPARQKEIFDEMIASGRYIPPKKYRDHENMIAWALTYFMTQEFESLSPDLQALCEQHIEERAQLAAQEKSGANPPSPAPNAPGPVPSAPGGPLPADTAPGASAESVPAAGPGIAPG